MFACAHQRQGDRGSPLFSEDQGAPSPLVPPPGVSNDDGNDRAMGGFKVNGGGDETRGQQVNRQFAYILTQIIILRRATALKKEEENKHETAAQTVNTRRVAVPTVPPIIQPRCFFFRVAAEFSSCRSTLVANSL